MTSLRDFIAARLDEDEAVALEAHHHRYKDALDSTTTHHGERGQGGVVMWSSRVLREVTAKRRVLARHCTPEADDYRAKYGGELGCVGCGDYETGSADIEWNVEYIENCPELRDLAAPYSDHPDYREEWVA